MLTREMLHEFLKTATCEEVRMMVGTTYIRCGNRAVAIVKHLKRNEGPYALCQSCASHNINNRGGVLVLACSDVGLDQIRDSERIVDLATVPGMEQTRIMTREEVDRIWPKK